MTITLRLMVITDTFGTIVRDALQENLAEAKECHAMLLLGDLPSVTYLMLRQDFGLELRGLCVLGNHDAKAWVDWLPRYNFTHVHNQVATMRIEGCEVNIAGLSGSERYKNNDTTWQWEDHEAENFMKKLPACDILLTHTAAKPPEGYPDDHRHRGLPAIGHYLQKHTPQLNLHGHFHHDYLTTYHQTQVIGCYGLNFVTCQINGETWKIDVESKVHFPWM